MRNKLLIFPATAIFLVLSLGGSAFAHHGFVSWYDMSHSVTVKGTVTGFDWTNPHSYIYMDVKNEKGAVEAWRIELAPGHAGQGRLEKRYAKVRRRNYRDRQSRQGRQAADASQQDCLCQRPGAF